MVSEWNRRGVVNITHSKMFIHDLTSFELGMIEMHHTSLFTPNSHSCLIWYLKIRSILTYALTRTTSFSSMISVYWPCSFSLICFTRSILKHGWVRHRVHDRGRRGRESTLLSSENIQSMFPHRCVTIILDFCLEFSEQRLLVIFIFFMSGIAPIVLRLIRFDQPGCKGCDFGVAVNDFQVNTMLSVAKISYHLDMK